MPTFSFGIEKEAEIYCSSSKMGLASDPQANGVISHLKYAFIEDGKVNLPLDECSDFIVQLCNQNVLSQIDSREDENGVAWTIALLAKAYIAASSTPCSYDALFKKCFIKYYNGGNDDSGSGSALPSDAVEEIEMTLEMVYYLGVAMPKQRLNTVDFLAAAYPILNEIDRQGTYPRRSIAQVMVNYFNNKLNPKQGDFWVNMMADSMARFRTFEELQSVMHIPEY